MNIRIENKKVIIMTFLLIMGMSDGFVFGSPYIRPTTLMIIFGCMIVIIRLRDVKLKFGLWFFVLILFIFLYCLNVLVQPNINSISYLGAYTLIFFFYLVVFNAYFYNFYNLDILVRACIAAACILSVFSIFEFLIYAMYSVNIQSIMSLYRLEGREAMALEVFLGSRVKRSYGFADEPTLFGASLGILSVIGWINVKYMSLPKQILFGTVCALGIAFTFSTATLMCISISFVITKIAWINIKSLKVLTIFMLLVTTIIVKIDFEDFNFLRKLLYLSETKRFLSASEAIIEFTRNPILGVGPGSTSASGLNVISWFGMLARETGLAGLVPIMIFFGLSMWRVRFRKDHKANNQHIFQAQFISFIFLFTNAIFFLPVLWIPFLSIFLPIKLRLR